MPLFTRQSVRYFSVIALALLADGGCDQVHSFVSRDGKDTTFELKQDSQGRVIRLNKVTGEVVIVDGTHLIPVTDTDPSAAGATSKRVQTTPRTLVRPATQPQAGADAEAAVPASGQAPAGSAVTITLAAPVFVTAGRSQTPLEVARKGSVLRLLGADGDWYRVEFDDPMWGRRVGFVEKKFAIVSPPDNNQLSPVDLSIQDPK